jgi:dTDP-4-dehydrorhamnose reductase
MPPLENAIARYAAIVRDAAFAGEAEALADRTAPEDFDRAAVRTS